MSDTDDLYLDEKQLSLLINLVNSTRKKKLRQKASSTFVPEPGHRDMLSDYIHHLENVAFILREARRRLQEEPAA